MHRDECCSSGVAVISFLAGTFVGAAISLLVAPQSGRETRDMIVGYGTDIRDKVTNIPDELKDGVKEYTGSAFDRGREMIERGKEMIERGTNIAEQGKDYLDEKKETLSAAIEAGKKAMQQEKEALAKALGREGEED